METEYRHGFQQKLVNIRYHHLKVLEEIEALDKAAVALQVDGRHHALILSDLHRHQRQLCEQDYTNICFNTVERIEGKRYPAPRLFIVLPLNLGSWDDSDPSTHKFRLYFMCDCRTHEDALQGTTQHVHLANHPGYNILRSKEFFQIYGDYVLRMLRIVQRGYSGRGARYNSSNVHVPSVNTFKILHGFSPNNTGIQISETTIEPLVQKAIAHLERLSLPTWFPDLDLTRAQCAEVKVYLDVREGDSTEGNLYRHISSSQNVSWMCQRHSFRVTDLGALSRLGEFVYSHGGFTDLQHAMLSIELGSEIEAGRFRSMLGDTKHFFDISVKLNWKATRLQVQDFCCQLDNAMALELDGVAPDIHSLGYVEHLTNLFADHIMPHCKLHIITLLNFPLPQQQCIYTGGCSLSLNSLPALCVHDWVDLRSDLQRFWTSVFEEPTESHVRMACTVLLSDLTKYGFSVTPVVRIHDDHRQAAFDVENFTILDHHLFCAWSSGMSTPMGSPSRLTVDYMYPRYREKPKSKSVTYSRTYLPPVYQYPPELFIEELEGAVKANTGLQDLNISIPGGNKINRIIEYVFPIWFSALRPMRLTLFERTLDRRGRVTAQVVITGRSDGATENTVSSLSLEQDQVPSPASIKFTQWDCGHVCTPRSDVSAWLLDTATQSNPLVLTSLTLDTSHVSKIWLERIRDVLSRSSLEHLQIVCTQFDHTLSGSICQVLHAVQLPTLKSLVFSGDNIDGWIKAWPLTIAPRLLRLEIHRAESSMQLSHSSALSVHYLIYSSPLTELYLENVQFQNKHDWDLVIQAVDYSLIEVFALSAKRSCRPKSAEDVRDSFGSTDSTTRPSPTFIP